MYVYIIVVNFLSLKHFSISVFLQLLTTKIIFPAFLSSRLLKTNKQINKQT